ncbi:ATP-dependent helicase [Candidatus Woesearchaeota archaeon]|nr:ATP-dependent helicase [Candidatus Woesearchaeota archaeon]
MITYKTVPNKPDELVTILNPTILRWFYSRFREFSLPQLYGVYEIHCRKNIIISAPTGATKTLTGFLSIINELVDSAQKNILQDKVYCVYISPLKALSNDIEKNLLGPLKEMEALHKSPLGIRIGVRTGDTTASEKQKMLRHPPHILITTPESLAIMLTSIKFRDALRAVDWCIIDEIHALADNKRGVHLSLSMERLQALSPAMCRIGLSATVAPLEEVAKFLVGTERDCQLVDVHFVKQLDLKVISPVSDLVDTTFSQLNKAMYTLIDKLIHEHKTTLVFTNTRAGTERVVHHLKTMYPHKYVELGEEPPGTVKTLIGAHHGSLSKRHRLMIEEKLRRGELKACVSSTSLELGLDIGYIDLVICLGSPKSVARFLQRAGRAGHKLHETVKARMIVLDRDDLLECSVLLKSAIERKIDRVHIPTNCLDVLAQQLVGIALEDPVAVSDVYTMVRQSYCYHNLPYGQFMQVIEYLAGEFADLEDRHVYAKIWHKDGKIGKRGKLTRVIFMTNIGTIPDETGVVVKVGTETIGVIDEQFLERLKKGDIFVLGGECYEFRHAKGMVAIVGAAVGRKPTVPSWVSEMLPLSFDLGLEIGKFCQYLEERFTKEESKKEIISFIHQFLYVDDNTAEAIYSYVREQHDYVSLPTAKRILVEHYSDGEKKYTIFHAAYGRRVNDVLSRAIAFAIGRSQHKDVEVGINDHGFYVSYDGSVNVMKAFELLKASELRPLLEMAIDQSEVLRRRFRHCACRSLMILRNYMGHTKRVGRQQVSSMILLNAVKRISDKFCILQEAKREVLEDLMDIANATVVLQGIEDKKIAVKEVTTNVPSPFAHTLVLQGYSDVLRIEDRVEFLKRMHELVMAKIGLKMKKMPNA